jgi:electron transfer flavoprotein alpha subunit
VVLEPHAAGDTMAAAARRVFMTEAARLAAALGARTRLVTWAADLDVDLDALATSLADLARVADPPAILVQDSVAGHQVAPTLAFRLGTGAVLGCRDAAVRGTQADDGPSTRALVFVKPVYGGWLEEDVTAAAGFAPVFTLDLEGFEPPDLFESPGAVEPSVEPEVVGSVRPSGPSVRHLDILPPDPRSVDLVHSKRIVAAGMGTAGDDLLAAVQELAELLEGSVGATRPMVDEGRLPKERLIGQTGRTVTPELYVALGVSGSPHHVAGVRKADRVLSVNRDVRAPIFQFSDVGFVAELEAVLPPLLEKIKAWRDAPAGGDHAR